MYMWHVLFVLNLCGQCQSPGATILSVEYERAIMHDPEKWSSLATTILVVLLNHGQLQANRLISPAGNAS